jgi:hypothetical protein
MLSTMWQARPRVGASSTLDREGPRAGLLLPRVRQLRRAGRMNEERGRGSGLSAAVPGLRTGGSPPPEEKSKPARPARGWRAGRAPREEDSWSGRQGLPRRPRAPRRCGHAPRPRAPGDPGRQADGSGRAPPFRHPGPMMRRLFAAPRLTGSGFSRNPERDYGGACACEEPQPEYASARHTTEVGSPGRDQPDVPPFAPGAERFLGGPVRGSGVLSC